MRKFIAILLAAAIALAAAACGPLPFFAASGEHGQAGDGAGGAAAAGGPVTVAKLKIAIDPGHGGKDYGAIGTDTGVLESELNLEVANLLAQLFRDAGAEVLMTRESAEVDYSGEAQTEKLKDMNNRARAIQDFAPDALISVHMNKFTERSVRGAEVFCQQGSGNGGDLAKCLQEELNKAINAQKPRRSHSGDFYILKVIEQPSVIVECGYLSNAEDEKLLQDPAHQQALAQCIYQGVCRYLGVE